MGTALRDNIPIVDIGPLVGQSGDRGAVANAIGEACRESGFFYVVGHGVDQSPQQRLEALSRTFFNLAPKTKLESRMELGGRAWRGYFPVGAELTSGQPDQKEGFYFGQELNNDHPLVAADVPLHGRNLFPDVPGFREAVLDYLDAMTQLGHTLMSAIGVALGLDESFFEEHYTTDPLVLFRIFHYPPLDESNASPVWSVGEHTDYGLLTMLRQDATGGLEIKSRSAWIAAPPIPDSFVCNIGDMLERMTGGRFRSTPHRVRNVSGQSRLSFPFFFDPNWNARIEPIIAPTADDDVNHRWDGRSVYDFEGTYGDYVLDKVSRVFPTLGHDSL